MCEKSTFAIPFHNELPEFVTCTLKILLKLPVSHHSILELITVPTGSHLKLYFYIVCKSHSVGAQYQLQNLQFIMNQTLAVSTSNCLVEAQPTHKFKSLYSHKQNKYITLQQLIAYYYKITKLHYVSLVIICSLHKL